jgi:hypothetical protein
VIAFHEHRARRLWAAEEYEGTERPPYPFQTGDARCIGRVLMRPMMFRGKRLVGLVPFDRLMEIEFKAREKRLNRKHFQ